VALDLVSDVNHLASSKLFGKSVLVQLHPSIISLSEVSVQTLNIIPVISVLSCIICIHTDETGEELYVHINFTEPRHVDIHCGLPPEFLRHPGHGCPGPARRHTSLDTVSQPAAGRGRGSSGDGLPAMSPQPAARGLAVAQMLLRFMALHVPSHLLPLLGHIHAFGIHGGNESCRLICCHVQRKASFCPLPALCLLQQAAQWDRPAGFSLEFPACFTRAAKPEEFAAQDCQKHLPLSVVLSPDAVTWMQLDGQFTLVFLRNVPSLGSRRKYYCCLLYILP